MKTMNQTELAAIVQKIDDAITLVSAVKDRVLQDPVSAAHIDFTRRVLTEALFELEQFVEE